MTSKTGILVTDYAENTILKKGYDGIKRFFFIFDRASQARSMQKFPDIYIRGCCWVPQWNVPNPSTISRALIPITFRSGKRLRIISNATSSFGSLNTGTIITVLPI